MKVERGTKSLLKYAIEVNVLFDLFKLKRLVAVKKTREENIEGKIKGNRMPARVNIAAHN